jgi:hypothetical protein
MEVIIGTKVYKHIETLTVGKLEHLLQLAEIEITNYKIICNRYPPERRALAARYLSRLEQECNIIKDELSRRS